MAFKVDQELTIADQTNNSNPDTKFNIPVPTKFALGLVAGALITAGCRPVIASQESNNAPIVGETQTSPETLVMPGIYAAEFAKEQITPEIQTAVKNGGLGEFNKLLGVSAVSETPGLEPVAFHLGTTTLGSDLVIFRSADNYIIKPYKVYVSRDEQGQIYFSYGVSKLENGVIKTDNFLDFHLRNLTEAELASLNPEQIRALIQQQLQNPENIGAVSIDNLADTQDAVNFNLEEESNESDVFHKLGKFLLNAGVQDVLAAGVPTSEVDAKLGTPTAPVNTPTLQPTPSIEPTPTIEPTQTSEQALAEYLKTPEAKESIEQFVNAMQMAGIEVTEEQVSQSLVFQDNRDINNNSYLVGTYNLDPNPTQTGETLEGPFPLIIAQKNENGEWKYKKYDLQVGFNISNKELQIRAEAGWGKSELRNGVEQGLKYFPDWVITNTLERVTYHPTDPTILNDHGIKIADQFILMSPDSGRVIGGHLIWGNKGDSNTKMKLPDYLFQADNNQLLNYGLSHLTQIMNHFYEKFPEKKYDWTVVAEATSEGNLFPEKLGLDLSNIKESYITKAFKKADELLKENNRVRGVDGDRLAYSDFITSLNDARIEEIILILKALKEDELIDVFYLQIRYGPNLNSNNPLTSEQLYGLIDKLVEETGVPIIIAELGVNGGSDESAIKSYGESMKACIEHQLCLGIMFDKVLPENAKDKELFVLKNNSAIPNANYYSVLKVIFENLKK